MKLKLSIICFVIAGCLIPVTASAFNIAQSVCDYIAADDKKRLRKLLKSNHLKLRKLQKEVTCNGKDLLLFAADRKSQTVGALLVKKLPKKILSANLAAVETSSPEIAALIQSRIK